MIDRVRYSMYYCDVRLVLLIIIFFFNDTATTEIYTLSLHDALPICRGARRGRLGEPGARRPRQRLVDALDVPRRRRRRRGRQDRKSTRLNSSHANISYAVFCLKKKKQTTNNSYIYYTIHNIIITQLI